jgi:phosphatidylserine/phosphatidylglycerophosphate/cardiolipin synthase-like enzyme
MNPARFYGVSTIIILISSFLLTTGDFQAIENQIDQSSIDIVEDNNNNNPRSVNNIVINEFMPDPASDWDGDFTFNSAGDEWVELYNYGPAQINISSWYINDSVAKKYTIPDDVIIPIGGFYTLYGSNQSLGLNNGGDTIELYNKTGFLIDSYTYITSDNDISKGRVPDGTDNWTELNEPTPGRTNGVLPKIVINEVMFDPVGTDVENEWLEIFNNDTRSINITGWQITDQDGEVDYIFETPENQYMVIPPQKYLSIHSSLGNDDLDFSDGVGELYMSKTSAMLNNDGDDILLTDRGGLCIDYVAYGRSTTIDPPPATHFWDGIWYDSNLSDYVPGNQNPDAEYSSTIYRILNGKDTNSVLDWGNASGIEITQGRNNSEVFGFDVEYDELVKYVNFGEQIQINLTLINLGKIQLNFQVQYTKPPYGWSAELNKSIFDLGVGKKTNISLSIIAPDNLTYGNEINLNISITATNVGLQKNISVIAVIPSVDLLITKFTIDDNIYLSEIQEGDVVYLKATVHNSGIIDGGGFSVGFYYDQVDNNHLIGVKEYDYIYDNSYKYPGIYWDTLDFQGNYTLIIIADANSEIPEPDEDNNIFEFNITIIDTSPMGDELSILITEVFHDPSISYDPNEYVGIYNPTKSIIDISGWQITDDPSNDFDETISLPDNTFLEPGQDLFITDEAEPFLRELGFEPDFACILGGLKKVGKLQNDNEWPGFANSGDLVILRDDNRHIIDLMCYGETNPIVSSKNWNGPPVQEIPEGKIYKRQREQRDPESSELTYIDTDSASDWQVPRLYGPGQSDFYPMKFQGTAETIPIVAPENCYVTLNQELDSAEDFIWLNIYEFTHPELAEKLLEAINRGINVRILLEGNPVGWNFSNVDDPEYQKEEEYTQKYLLSKLYDSGAEIKFLSNIKNDNRIKSLNKRYNYNHAKYCIIDNETSIIMSGNWKPTSVPVDISFGNREWGVVVKDKSVTSYLMDVFMLDWEPFSEFQNDTHFFDLNSKVYGPPPEFFDFEYSNSKNWYNPISNIVTNTPNQLVSGEFSFELVLAPDTSTRADSGIIGMIKDAKESVLIQQMDCNIDWRYSQKSTNKLIFNWSDLEHYCLNWLDGKYYFNEYLISAIDAAKRGCDVKILLDSRYVELGSGPGDSYGDPDMDNLDTVQYINKLAQLEGISDRLEARLSYLSGLEKVHNKGVVVDSKKVLLSSINWNYNSVTNNREVGLIVENNKFAEFYIEVFEHDWSMSKAVNKPTKLNGSESSILFTELYPDTYTPYDSDEYFAISNPTSDIIDMSGWIITDKLTKYTGYEGALLFPLGAFIGPGNTIYVSRTASTFYAEHNFLPDFEYSEDSRTDVPQMEIIDSSSGSSRGLQLANKGDEIVIADEYLFFDLGSEAEHMIDMVVYGNSTIVTNNALLTHPFNSTSQWSGQAIYNISEGEILKRNRVESKIEQDRLSSQFQDTNSASDWENYMIYHPGQSDFRFYPISYTGSATVFTSPDSSYEVLSSELEKAKKTIYLSIYQFHNLYLMEKLVNASLRGVDVNVLIDGAPVGGLTDLGKFVAKQLVDKGCQVRYIRSVSKDNIHRRYSYLHSKYTVIDNFTTVVMSENWKLSGVPVDNTIGNRGWGVVLRNSELALSFAQVFFSDWNPNMKDIYAYNKSHSKYGAPPEDFIPSWSVYGGYYKPRFNSRTINGDFTVTPVVAPDTTTNSYNSILELIHSAEDSVLIEQLNCYLDWDYKGRERKNLYLEAAIAAARRGCDVKILLDSVWANPDYAGLDNYDTVQYINTIARTENLSGNLQAKLIYLDGSAGENELSMLHNKGIVVDGKKVLVSSINWATGSIINNREVGVIIENGRIARYFTDVFYYDWNLTVQELIKVYVMHSDMREVLPGDSTEYVISVLNTQPMDLEVKLSISGLKYSWTAELDRTNIILTSNLDNETTPVEFRLKVTAPDREYVDEFLSNPDLKLNYNDLAISEIGIIFETQGMSVDVIFTTTHLLDSEEDSGKGKDKDEPTDRSVFDPVMVIIILGILIIMGAVVRDVIHSRLEKKKKKVDEDMGDREDEMVEEE